MDNWWDQDVCCLIYLNLLINRINYFCKITYDYHFPLRQEHDFAFIQYNFSGFPSPHRH